MSCSRGRYPQVVVDNTRKDIDQPVIPVGNSEESIQKQENEALSTAKKYKPRGMKKEEQKVWDRLLVEVILAGRFKPLFVDFYKQYCVVVARMDVFAEYLEENGWKYTTQGRNGTQHRPRPEAAQYNDDWRKWNSLVNQIGMSPATDQRFHNMQPDLFGDDPYSNM